MCMQQKCLIQSVEGASKVHKICNTYRTQHYDMYVYDHYSPKDVYPNCLQTTWASRLSHPLPHTVPHSLSTQISTLPSLWLDPPTKRIWPWEQFAGTGIYSTVPNHKWCFTWTWKFDDGNHYFCLFQFLVFKLEFTAVDFYTYMYILYIRLSKYFQFIKWL